jgi:hypothetical protein
MYVKRLTKYSLPTKLKENNTKKLFVSFLDNGTNNAIEQK